MRTKLRIALGALLGIALFVVALPISSAAPPSPTVVASSPDQERGERGHVKQGPEVGKRVKQLQKFNKNVRNALADFEKNAKRNGHRPKHDESLSLTLDPAGGPSSSAALKSANAAASPFRKVGFKPQDPDYSAYGVEMIFIPTYSVPGEWQGTVIFNQFDPSGAYLGQYVADVAMVVDPTATFWDVIYEVSYEDGEAYIQYGDPNFDLGTPNDLQGPGGLQGPISAMLRPDFRKASFNTMTPQGRFPRPPGYPPNPRVRWVMKCTTIGSVAVAIGCGVASLPVFGAPFPPCMAGGAATAVTYCVLTAIFGG